MRYTTRLLSPLLALLLLATFAGFAGTAPTAAAAAPTCGPGSPFWTYSGTTPLADIAPGTVLKSQTLTYWGLWWPVTVTQLLYRSTNVLGQPTANVTSVIEPSSSSGPTRAVSLQSAYDSLNPSDEPSVTIACDHASLAVSGTVTSLHNAGDTVIVPDTEGQRADMTEGREYGMNTLDAIRAATNSPLTGLSASTPVALMGYSGGAWATEWAAQLAPSYAPDVNGQLVGAAVGGLPVDAAHIAQYISGSSMFTGELPTALIGMSRAYDVDFTPYLSAEGLELSSKLQDASLGSTIWGYSGLKYSDLFKTQYADPNSIPGYVDIVNNENLGLVNPATIPLYIVQGGTGWIEGIQPQPPSIGPGDGATVTGDVRALALQACAAGTAVNYNELDGDDHLLASSVFTSNAPSWIADRFSGVAAPNNCSSIAPGNSLAAEQPVPPAS